MELKIHRYGLEIVPDDDDMRDVAFIEEVLGLQNEGDFIKLVRHNASGLSDLSSLEAERGENNWDADTVTFINQNAQKIFLKGELERIASLEAHNIDQQADYFHLAKQIAKEALLKASTKEEQ